MILKSQSRLRLSRGKEAILKKRGVRSHLIHWPTSISINLAQLQRMLYLDPRLGYYQQFGHGGMGSCKRNSKF